MENIHHERFSMDQNCTTGRGNPRMSYPNYTRERIRRAPMPPHSEVVCDHHHHHPAPPPCGTIQPRQTAPSRTTQSTCAPKPAVPPCAVKPARPADNWKNMPVGMTYVPWQEFGTPMDTCAGYQKGTIFPCLDYPFYVGGCYK